MPCVWNYTSLSQQALCNMLELTEERTELCELRDAAYHEAGHKIMCELLGGLGKAAIWRNVSGNADEKTWLGHFRTQACPQQLHDLRKGHSFYTFDLPSDWRALVGVAGAVAEEILWENADDVDLIADAIHSRIFCDEMSASDLASMGIADIWNFKLNRQVVEDAWRYLKLDWPRVHAEAENLIEEALVSVAKD
jgi:hypothetical protein